ncbi:NAD(P)-binding protein [Panus rudis PR-1116 ss-1]|nr:NAD(P)-binding protein [Panus rudis PR-1116 ss-1]
MADILVLGATGYTGRLITRYLNDHPQRSEFTYAIAGRSKSKLGQLKKTLNLDESVRTFEVDVTDKDGLEEVIKQVKVVINTVGPYYVWSTPVVRACVRNGKHYVDISGEPHWTRDIILEYDYLATKTHSVIIPGCAFNSLLFDLSVYLSYKELKSISPDSSIDRSVSACKARGGISGGTLGSIMSDFENLPAWKRTMSRQDWAISPIMGSPQPPIQQVGQLPYTYPPVFCGLAVSGYINRLNIQRTWSLLEFIRRQSARETHATSTLPSYGPSFRYEEFTIMPSKFTAMLFFTIVNAIMTSLSFALVRWFLKKIVPKPGDGPSEATLKNGFVELINITSSSDPKPKHVRTVIKGKGDPGYALTSVMVSESALSLLLHQSELPAFSDAWKNSSEFGVGGILTPVSALGDVLVRRLESTGRFDFVSEVIDEVKSGATRKKLE